MWLKPVLGLIQGRQHPACLKDGQEANGNNYLRNLQNLF